MERIQRISDQQWYATTYTVRVGAWKGEPVFTGNYPQCRKEAVARAEGGGRHLGNHCRMR